MSTQRSVTIERHGRGSGRTTRMLEEAVRYAQQGVYVFVLCANESHARQLQDVCARRYHGAIAGTKVYLPDGGGIAFEHAGTDEAQRLLARLPKDSQPEGATG